MAKLLASLVGGRSTKPRRHRRALPAGGRIEWLEQRLALAPFLVTTTADNGDNTTPTPGSLRAAIVGVNASADPSNTIDFDIPGSGVQTITPPIELPTITNPVTINGYSQPGSSPNTNTLDQGDNATILIELNGSALAGSNSAGLTISAASATISGLVINSVSSGNGIAYTGSGTVDVNGTFVGVDPTASAARGNNWGVYLAGGSSETIGGTTAAARNVISGNAFGIVSFPPNTLVEGNYIGTNAAGQAAVGGGTGIYIGGTSATIGGTATGARNVISGNNGYGIYLAGSNGLVEGNYIGTDAAGEAALGNGNGGFNITGAAATIGGTTTAARNVISANGADGILISAPSGLIEGNYIGVDATGEKALGNRVYGVRVNGQASSTTIGGTAAGAGNVVSANGNDGIVLDAVANALIEGNFIGTNEAGDTALGNTDSGVDVRSTSPSVTIGGTTAGALNVISGNGGYGIMLGGPNGLVQGNYVGVSEGGGSALGNELGGVFVGSSASSATIGGTSTAAAGNVISGNEGSGANEGNGVLIESNGNLVVGNDIGTAAFAAGGGPVPNAGDGIQLAPGADFNTIGGTSVPAINYIASNGGDGIDIQSASNNTIYWNLIGRNSYGVFINAGSNNDIIGSPSVLPAIANNVHAGVAIVGLAPGNRIQGYRIYGNGGLGIDLGNDGVTPNHTTSPTPGPNNFQNYPILIGASDSTVSGYLDSTPAHNFTIEFFANPAPDPSGHGQGQQILGQVAVTTGADGTASFTATLSTAIPAGWIVSSTATDMKTGDTSEFSGLNVAPVVVAPPVASTEKGVPYAFGPSAFNVSDVDGAVVQKVTITVGSGVLSLGSSAGLSVSGNNTGTLTMVGTLANLNVALGTLTYVPNKGFVGHDTLTIVVDDQADPALGGPLTDTAATAIDVHQPTPPPPADLVVTKSASPSTVSVGQDVTYTIAVANRGPGVAKDVELVDDLPDSFHLVTATASKGVVSVSGHTIAVDLARLSAGRSLTLTVVAIPSAAGTFVNVASAASSTDDPDSSNNSAQASVNVTTNLGPPTVLSLQRFGFHKQPTTFVLTFNSALDPARAQDVQNYNLAPISPSGHLGKEIKIVSVVYAPLTMTVTIHPATRVYLFKRYRLEVNGTPPAGLASPSGIFLDGAGNGIPGSNFVRIFGPSILAGPNPRVSRRTNHKIRRSTSADSSTKPTRPFHVESSRAIEPTRLAVPKGEPSRLPRMRYLERSFLRSGVKLGVESRAVVEMPHFRYSDAR
jgi:uncharacterized repeat protein (TIGR01451 family)